MPRIYQLLLMLTIKILIEIEKDHCQMAACSFDMKFVQVQASWEGSAAGSIVLQAAERSGLISCPKRCIVVNFMKKKDT